MWALQIYNERYAYTTNANRTAMWSKDYREAIMFESLREAREFVDLHVPLSLVRHLKIVEME